MTIWTTPLTWDTGRLVTANDLNAQIRDNLLYLKQRQAKVVGGVTFTTSSTSFVPALETQNIITTTGGRALCVGYGYATSPSAQSATRFFLNLQVDGSDVIGGTEGLVNGALTGTQLYASPWSFMYLTPVLTPAMHTFRPYVRVLSGSVGFWFGQFWVLEV